MKLNQTNEFVDHGLENNYNYDQHFSSENNFIPANQIIKKADHSNGTFHNYL